MSSSPQGPYTICQRKSGMKSFATSGANAFSVLVEKPFIPTAPDAEACAFLYRSGELMGYYWDWEIVHAVEEIFDCMSSGKPHQHAVNRVIARRYGGGTSSNFV